MPSPPETNGKLSSQVAVPAVLPGPLDLPRSTLEGAGVDDAGAVVGRVAVQRVVGRDRFGNRQTMTSTAIAGYTFTASYALRKPTPAGFVEMTTQSDFVTSATTVGLIDGHIRMEMVSQVRQSDPPPCTFRVKSRIYDLHDAPMRAKFGSELWRSTLVGVSRILNPSFALYESGFHKPPYRLALDIHPHTASSAASAREVTMKAHDGDGAETSRLAHR
jgi:hypothetical protein